MMTLQTRCSNPNCQARLKADLRTQTTPTCPACGGPLLIRAQPDWQSDGRIDRCPCCGAAEFFVRKDFPQNLGLAVVVVAAVASFILFSRHTLVALALLAGVVILDAAIYLFVGKVTVCYRCRAEFRGVRYNPAHNAFDLATAEKYPKV